MIRLFTSAFYVSQPHRIGGGGAIIESEAGEIGRVKRVFGPSDVTSSIAAELVILAEALEKASAAGGRGEEVLLRTGFSSIAEVCKGRVPKGVPELRALVARVSEIAREFGEIQAQVVPSYVTARPHDLAVRAILDQGREARGIAERGNAAMESTPRS